jgi:hypothetical protein
MPSRTGGRCAGGVVHAINPTAVSFYERFGFRGLSDAPRSLMVTWLSSKEAGYGR